jgi:outer membrane protein OmpA-like peptidoglycan-associated protein
VSNPLDLENLMARRLLIASLSLTLVAAAAMAQDVRQYAPGDVVNPSEVAAILGAPRIKYRSIRLLDDPSAAAGDAALAVAGGSALYAAAATAATAATPSMAANPAAAADGVPSALSLPVQFSFDSADILPAARQQLDALAEGIRLLPQAKPVVIEGHTDAAGPEQYNEQLSQRRAQAVKRYLVASHGINPARLRAVGMGEYKPLAGSDPYASENRRVQFRGDASFQ